jgi:hypothetical protein
LNFFNIIVGRIKIRGDRKMSKNENEIKINDKKIEKTAIMLMGAIKKDKSEDNSSNLIYQLVKEIPKELVFGKSLGELRKLSLDIASMAIRNKKCENLFRKFFEEKQTMPKDVKFVSRMVSMTQLILGILFIKQLKAEGREKVMERFGKEFAPEIEAMEERLKYIG